MPTTGSAEERWSRYLDWNAALAAVVYGPESSGIPVFLDLEYDVLAKIAIDAGGLCDNPRQELIKAVHPTLNAVGHQAGIFGSHRARLLRWKIESGEPPPTIALLAVLSLAAEDMHGGDGFATHDYYNRLMPLLGVTNEHDKERVINAYRRCSGQLWGSLNDWLESQEGERGIPTAFSLGFAHVGFPVSQAILRATDREKLREFFRDFGFAPRSHLSPRDMEVLLGEWIGRTPSPASNAMETLWHRQAARDRIIEGACALLESWDGPTISSSGDAGDSRAQRTAPIQLVALLRTFPTSVLELNFTGPSSSSDDEALELIDADENASESLLAIEPLTESRWWLAEPGRVEPRSVLDGRLRLRDSGGLMMERRPRRVVSLTKDDLLQVFLEVERLPLGEASLILCKDELAESIDTALAIIARPGFLRAPAGLNGLPPGWTLFSDVQVLAALPAVQPDGSRWSFELDLNVLQPLSTSQLVVEEGLRLPGHLRRWSSLAPPEIRVATEDAKSIVVTVTQTRALAQSAEAINSTSEGSAAVVRLADLSLPDGDYEVLASNTTTGKTIDQIRLRLRSADVSNPAPPRLPPLARSLSTSAFAVIGASVAEGETDSTIQGALVRSVSILGGDALVAVATTGAPAWWDARASAGNRAARPERVVVPSVVLEDCFRTGSHVMVLPKFYGSASSSSFQGFCKQCGIVKRYPSYYRARSATTQDRQRYVPPSFDPSRIARVTDRVVPPDVALDALGHDRAGNARAFEQLALQIEPSQLFVDRFLRGLESLGHLEVRRDPRTLAPTSWEVAPAALVQLKPDTFMLAGFRSRRLCTAVERAATTLGLTVDRRRQDAAPDRIRVRDCDLDLAKIVARRVFDEIGSTPNIVPDAAATMTRYLPRLSSVLAELPQSAMVGFRSANKWDERLASWVAVTDASSPGAFQLLGSTSVYCLRDEDDVNSGTMRRGDARLVKHLASSRAGYPLLGYDEETETLYSPLGAELPGLYARTAVLASGLLPTDDLEQRLVAYPSVPAHLAGQLIALMRS